MEFGDKVPDKKTWRGNWDERQARKIYELARHYRARNGCPMDAAWYAAEQAFCNQRDRSWQKAIKR